MRRFCITCVLFMIAISGCATTPVSREEIVGSWVNAKGTRLSFTVDGKVSMTQFPCSLLHGSLCQGRFDYDGQWSFDGDSVILNIVRSDQQDRHRLSVRVFSRNADLIIRFWSEGVGDEDAKFQKQ
jgi:hypothetical protein